MLTTKRPTQTTVLYTVSTRSPAQTIPARLSGYGSILVRIVTGILVILVLLHEFSASKSFHRGDLATWLRTRLVDSPLALPAVLLARHLSWTWRMIVSAAVTWLTFQKGYTEESLLVIRGLGVQTSTSSPSWLWTGGSTRFIPTSCIQDVFIYEAFKGFEVKYYLGIVVEGEGDVVVVFPSVLPRREILEQVWRGARACLYEPKP